MPSTGCEHHLPVRLVHWPRGDRNCHAGKSRTRRRGETPLGQWAVRSSSSQPQVKVGSFDDDNCLGCRPLPHVRPEELCFDLAGANDPPALTNLLAGVVSGMHVRTQGPARRQRHVLRLSGRCRPGGRFARLWSAGSGRLAHQWDSAGGIQDPLRQSGAVRLMTGFSKSRIVVEMDGA